MISFISLIGIISTIVTEPKVPEVTVPKMFYEFLHLLLLLLLLILILSTHFWPMAVSAFFINEKSTFINGPRRLPSNLPNYIILNS